MSDLVNSTNLRVGIVAAVVLLLSVVFLQCSSSEEDVVASHGPDSVESSAPVVITAGEDEQDQPTDNLEILVVEED